MKTAYDPFNREDDERAEREAAAREEHESWSRAQSLKGNSADRRDGCGTWTSMRPKVDEESEAHG